MQQHRTGFTLIELLVVIAVIAMLAAILFAVFGKAREKARQAACMSNQRQIATEILMSAQDHDELLPGNAEVWTLPDLTPGLRRCPSAGKLHDGYVYNSAIAGTALGDIEAPQSVYLTADGKGRYVGLSSLNDFALRHSGRLIVSFADGHVALHPIFGLLTKNPVDGAAIVPVTAGTFMMGEAIPDYPGNAEPAHPVTLTRSYYVYQYEVTVGQYRAFCAATQRDMPEAPAGYVPAWSGWSGRENYPMVMVNWDDAAAYARWAGADLPTEAQWEFASRGPEDYSWPWGNTWDAEKCNNYFDHSSAGGGYVSLQPAPVGSYPAGAAPCGAQDMGGNVWEWCTDWYGPYASDALTDPTGPVDGTSRVLHGGGWQNSGAYCARGACRGANTPDTRTNYSGFRCILNLPDS